MAERLLINTADHDSKGRCIRHPTIRLRKKKFFGGWKIIIGHCPECCLNEMRRVRDEMKNLRQRGDREDSDDDGTDDEEETERQRVKKERKKKKKKENEKKSKNEPVLSMAFTDPLTGNHGTYTGQINFSNRMPDGKGTVYYASGGVAEGTWKNGILVESENEGSMNGRRGRAGKTPGPKSSPPQDEERIRSPSSRKLAAREVDGNRSPGGNLDMLDRLDRRAKSKPNHGSTSVRSNDSHGTLDLPSGGASAPIDCSGGGIVNLSADASQGRFDKPTKNPHDTSGNLDVLDRLDRRAKSKPNHGSTSVRSINSHGTLDLPSGGASAPINYGGGGIVNLSADGSRGRFAKPTKNPHGSSGSFSGGSLDMLERIDRRAKMGSTSVQSFGSNESMDDGSKALKIKTAQLENSLKDATLELNKSQRSQEKLILDISSLQIENAALLKKIVDDQAQNLSEKDLIMDELNHLKLEKVKLEVDLSQLQCWSETAQSYLPEVEAKLKQVTAERDNLMTQLESYASARNETRSQDYNQMYKFFQIELDEKNEQLDRIRNHIQNADGSNAEMDKLREDLEVEKGRADGLSQEKSSLSAIAKNLSLEKEHRSCTLAVGQAVPDSVDVSTIDADTQKDEAQLCMSDLEAPNVCAQVDNLMPLEEKVTAVIAEHDEIQSHLSQITEEYENIQVLELDNSSIQNTEKHSLEEEHVICTLSERHAVPDSGDVSTIDVDTQKDEAQLCMSDLEAPIVCASEAQVDSLMPLEEKVIAVTA
jgi:predicted  nucleic acid-binding Zn-ribbon protein